jgi:hypothetical protein
MVHPPFEEVTVVVVPSALVVDALAIADAPSPECTVTPDGPVVMPETRPPPAVTEVDIEFDGGASPGLS